MEKYTLENITGGKDGVLDELPLSDEWLGASFKGKAKALEIAKAVAERRGKRCVYLGMVQTITDTYDSFVASNGERPLDGDPAVDEWDSAIDDEIAALFEPWDRQLSADFLGRATIDTRLHMPGEIDRLANAFADEIWKQLTYDTETGTSKSVAKILSAVGIVGTDLDGLIGQPQRQEIPMAEFRPIISKIENYTQLVTGEPVTADDLDLLTDSDDTLALATAQKLGVTIDEARVLRQVRNVRGKAVFESWLAAINDSVPLPADAPDDIPEKLIRVPPPPPPPPAPEVQSQGQGAGTVPPPVAPPANTVPPPPPPPPGTPAAPIIDQRPTARQIPAETLQAIKAYTGVKDEEAAAAVGISRASYNNYMKGKSPFMATDAQVEGLAKLVQRHIQGLNEVVELLR